MDRSITGTLKLDHVWSRLPHVGDVRHLRLQEPQPRSYRRRARTSGNPADPGEGALLPPVHASPEQHVTPDSTTVAHVRWATPPSATTTCRPRFDPGTLGFSPNFVSQIPWRSSRTSAWARTARTTTATCSATGPSTTYLLLVGGQRLHVEALGRTRSSSAHPTADRDEASLPASRPAVLLRRPVHARRSAEHPDTATRTRWPRSCSDTPTRRPHPVATSINASIDYYAGYTQDDFRLNSKLTVNVGLRYEFEQGLRRRTTRSPSGSTATGPGRSRSRAPPSGAGSCTRASTATPPTRATPARRSSRRARASPGRLDPDRGPRRLRPLLGASPVPGTAHQPGHAGFTQITDYVATTDGGLTPCAAAREPVPHRPLPAQGSAQRPPHRRRGAWTSLTSSASPRTSTSSR